MNNDFISFSITDFNQVKKQLLNWVNQFNVCSFLDNHQYHFDHHSYECIAGAGAMHSLKTSAGSAFEQLHQFRQKHTGWLFGHFGYDLKNELENVVSANIDHIHFPDLFFFVPAVVLLLKEKELAICSNNGKPPQEIFEAIIAMDAGKLNSVPSRPVIRSRFSKAAYIETIEKLRAHIQRGDCYEINFCQEFFAEGCALDVIDTYHSLSAASPNPFGAYYKIEDNYLFCASPERYLKKTGNRIISQPIKGTWKRDLKNSITDEQHKQQLQQSAKNRSENVMVVDLVRNDLSRICREGSVGVEELFGVYSFPQVHQMISTVTGELKPGISFVDIIKATFPMGSMTGAPKKRVLQLIEQYEKTRRGVFSGAVGYITPEGDFDFNVVIRSILYNRANQYLSYQVGSGITFYSNAEEEYEECLLKAAAIKKVLEPQHL